MAYVPSIYPLLYRKDTFKKIFTYLVVWVLGLPQWLSGKESTYNVEAAVEVGLISESGRSLVEGRATHSSILAWRIQWTEEPGGLQSIGSQRVGQD